MSYEDFICAVQTQMQERLGEEVQIQLHQIMKNNSVLLDAVSISEKGSGIAPTIYLNDFYQDYERGKSLPEILDLMEEIYRKSCVDISFDASFYTDYEKVKERLACRLINRRKNEELLKRVPYLPFLDLAVVVYYSFEDKRLGNGTILVYESHVKSWGISKEDLFEKARENTLKIQSAEFLSMEGILEKYRAAHTKEPEGAEEGEECIRPMYVLTNSSNYFGAAGLLFDSVLQDIAQKLDDDFWVLPSSIHECVIVPASLPMTREEMQMMVREINRSEVETEDYLSDEIYFYRRSVHRLSL